MPPPKRFVYILKSITNPAAYHVGITSDMPARLSAHNADLSRHIASLRPWRALVVIEFDEEAPALAFEQYLKTGWAASSHGVIFGKPSRAVRTRDSNVDRGK